MDNATTALSTTLSHVFPFLNKSNGGQKQDDAPSPTDSTTSNDSALTAATQKSDLSTVATTPAQSTRASSPVSQFDTDRDASKTTSPLKADAPAFVPMTYGPLPPPPMFEQRKVADKGMGLFATRDIRRGTLVISEKPLLEIVQNRLDLAYHEYLRLPVGKRAAFDALHCYLPSKIDAEHDARVCAIHFKISENELPHYIAEHARVMGIFACNDFQLANGHLGVFNTTSRLNHSCIPNVHHTNNPVLGEETIYTIRDIKAGEELLINYLGPRATYDMRNTRIAQLREAYGFTCQCNACTDATGTSDQRRDILSGIFYGLNEFAAGTPSDTRFIPSSPQMALAQAEDGIRILIEEQLLTIELIKAYRVASTLALTIHDFDKALEYAFNEEEIERNILGHEVSDLERINMAAKNWIEKVYLAACGNGFNYKGQWLRLYPTRIQSMIEGIETKRLARGPFKKHHHKLSKKKSEHVEKKKQDRSSPKKAASKKDFSPKKGSSRVNAGVDENIMPPPTTGENQWT